ncbi:acyltransferase [Ravibacter arvi]
MSLSDLIKSKPTLKKWIHFLLIPGNEARPRRWVRWFVNPFFQHRGRQVIIRRRTRMDLLPFNDFRIGTGSVIEDFSTINNGVGHVVIGAHSLIGMSNVVIGPVTIGDNVIMAQHVVVSGLNHNYTDPALPISRQGVSVKAVVIEDDCWIGANAVITSGVTVGKHSVVAAGSVVTRDVPPFSVVAGNPARPVKRFDTGSGTWLRL